MPGDNTIWNGFSLLGETSPGGDIGRNWDLALQRKLKCPNKTESETSFKDWKPREDFFGDLSDGGEAEHPWPH